MKQTTEQVQEIHRKGWGKELWITNKPEYCGKILYFSQGKKCSIHYHKLKDEVFYLLKGKLDIYFSEKDFTSRDVQDFVVYKIKNGVSKIVLLPGETFHVYPGLRHQMYAWEDSELLEISTQHFDEDSIRVEKGD